MLKKTITLFFLLILPFSFINCKAENVNSLNSIEKKENFKRVSGLVEVHGNEVYVVERPECKCRKTYKVLGDKKRDLKRLKGLYVEVEGYVNEKTPWSAEILVKKVHILEK